MKQISIRSPLHRLVRKSFKESHIDSHHAELEQYVVHRLDISDDAFDRISWNTLHSFSRSLSLYKRRRYQKVFHMKWLTMRENYKMNLNKTDLCPVCRRTRETCNHVLECKARGTLNGRHEANKTCILRLMNHHIPPELARLIVKGVTHFTLSAAEVLAVEKSLSYFGKTIRTALKDQQRIGWMHANRGLLSKKWLIVGSCHLQY